MSRAPVLALVVILGACRAEAREQPAASSGPVRDHLALLALGRPLESAQRDRASSLDDYLEMLVRDPDFARIVVPRVLLGELNFGPLSYYGMHALKSTVVDGQTVHHYRKPCALADSVEVVPWWDQSTRIRICSADYKPEGYKSKDGHYCSGTMVWSSPECGCGVKLVNCVRDSKHNAELIESLYQETIGTIAHLVGADAPLADVFTTVSSFRDRNTEYMRMRDKLYAGKIRDIPDLASWPAEGKWAPREELFPGAHSGILTNIQYLYISDGPRDRMRLVFARTWCSTPGSFGVTSAQFSELVAGHADIRSTAEGWKGIAAAPGCTDCHARMDYGMQFFMAYPPIGTSVTPILGASRHTERGPMYLRDIDDPRGEAKLTPRALGELIVKQPEFAACMVTRVQDHVLGSSATPEDRKVLLDTFAATGKMRPLFVAALRLFAQRAAMHAPPPLPAITVSPKATGDEVAVPVALATAIEKHCGDCHEDGKHPIFAGLATKRSLSRELVLTTANLVAADLMPKDGVLGNADKRAMLAQIIELLAPDATWAANASAYWLDQLAGSRTHQLSAVKERVATEAGYELAPEDRARTVEDVLEAELLTVTPSFMSELGQVALKTCRPLAADTERYRACLRKATRPDAFLVR
jgi:hypothetical protein